MADTKAVIFDGGKFQGISNNGQVTSNGKLYFFESVSGNEVDTFTDSLMQTKNTHPIILSSSGKADVFVTDGQFDVTLQDKNGVTIWTINNYIPAGGQTQLAPIVAIPTKEEFTGITGNGIILESTPQTTVGVHKNGLILNTDEYELSGKSILFVDSLIATDEMVVEFTKVIADSGNQGVQYNVSLVSDILALDITYEGVNVKGYTAENDGGGGIFNYDSTIDKATANGGTIIDPDVTLPNQGSGAGTGCWIRQYSGAVNIRWFGASPDAFDNYDAITAAFAAGQAGSIFIPIGEYIVRQTLLLPSYTKLFGEERSFSGSSIKAIHVGYSVLSLKGAIHSVVEDINITTDNAIFPKTGFLMGRETSASSGHHQTKNLRIQGYFSEAAIYSIASEVNTHIDLYVWQLDVTAKYVFYTSASDDLAVASLVTSTNLGCTMISPYFLNNSTDADAACIYMKATQSMGSWNFIGGYLIPTSGSYVHMEIIGAEPSHPLGPFTFTGTSGERMSGGDPLYGFRLDAAAAATLVGLSITGCRTDLLDSGTTEHFDIKQSANLVLNSPNIVIQPPEAFPYATSELYRGKINGGIATAGRFHNWEAAVLGTDWIESIGAPFEAAGYRMDTTSQVQLRGSISSGTTNLIMTLPVGYRPRYNMYFPIELKSTSVNTFYADYMTTGIDVRHDQIVIDNNGGGTGHYYKVLTNGTTNNITVAADTGGATYELVQERGIGRVQITAATGAVNIVEGYTSGLTVGVDLANIKFQSGEVS